MFRDKEEELQRLEQLLAQEEEENDEEAVNAEPEEEIARNCPGRRDYRMYNTDQCDVDLEKFSEEVFTEPRKPVLPWIFGALTTVLLLLLYLYLKQGGYL